jgi:hypothetical protein
LTALDPSTLAAVQGNAGKRGLVLVGSDPLLNYLGKRTIENHCGGLKVKALATENQRYLAICDRAKRLARGFELAECAAALVAYRNAVIDWNTRSTPLFEIQDSEVLKAKSAAARDRGDKSALVDITARRAELEPRNEEALIGAAFAILEDWKSPDAEAKLNSLVAQLNSLHPNSPAALELQLNASRVSEDYDGMQKLATTARETDEELGNYYLAWASVLSGNPTKAQAYLKEVVERNPGNMVASLALNNLESGKSRDEVLQSFTSSLTASRP